MRKLSVPLAAISDSSAYKVDESFCESDVRPDDAKSLALKEAEVTGTMVAVETEYLFRGTVRGTFENPCDRCLESTKYEYSQEVNWFFERGQAAHPFEELIHGHEVEEVVDLDEPDPFADENGADHVRHFEGDRIDLGPHVWEELVLTAPGKFLCTETCAGLCAWCGVNLNTTTCGCPRESETEKSESGFAALKDMFPNLRSQSTEE